MMSLGHGGVVVRTANGLTKFFRGTGKERRVVLLTGGGREYCEVVSKVALYLLWLLEAA